MPALLGRNGVRRARTASARGQHVETGLVPFRWLTFVRLFNIHSFWESWLSLIEWSLRSVTCGLYSAFVIVLYPNLHLSLGMNHLYSFHISFVHIYQAVTLYFNLLFYALPIYVDTRRGGLL